MKGMLLRMAYRRADNVPCISSYTETRLKEHVPEAKTTIIHHGCIPLTVPSKEEIHALQKKFSIPEDAFPLVISVGEVKERKGQYDTLQGIVRLKERFPRIVYCLAGRFEVAYRSSMEALAKDAGMEHAIRFLGPLTDDRELASLYSLADVHALNSNNDGVHQEHFEGFGLVVVEAGQFGVPSVGSKQTGIEDAISDGDSGILVAQKDHDGIKDAIVRLVEDREHFKKGAKRWAEQFSWDRTAEHILQLYES
jgi:phosphatidylinositol alpha-1,6-mannosyltransferase